MADRLWRWLGIKREGAGADTRLFADRLRLGASEVRRLLGHGTWVDLASGERLTEEGQRPAALWFLLSGEVDIQRLGEQVARCGRGNFVGEMAMLEDEAVASATSIVRSAGRAWRLDYESIAPLEKSDPRAFGALQGAIARDMRLKLVAQNVRHAGI